MMLTMMAMVRCRCCEGTARSGVSAARVGTRPHRTLVVRELRCAPYENGSR
jgi:hypothetical protein